MNNPLILVASLVATFVLGAVVALYGFGDAITASSVGCFAFRPGSIQQDKCVEDALESCRDMYDNRQEQNTCMKAMIGGRLTMDKTKEPAGETQKLHNAGAARDGGRE